MSLFDEMVRYIRFDADDQAALRALYPDVQPHFTDISETFYERLLEHDEAASVLKSEAQVERLKLSMCHWLDRLLSGPWDEDYYEMRARIGKMHVKVNLPQRYMFTAMSVIRVQLHAIAETACGQDRERLRAATRALSRILDLELAIMLESYQEYHDAAARRFEKLEKDRLSRRLELSEACYEAVVENAEVLVIAIDSSGHVALFNREAEKTSGYLRNEIIGQPGVETLCHPDDRERVQQAIDAALDGEPTSIFEARIMTTRGAERLIRWHLTPPTTGEATLACAIGVDITEERQLEQRTRRAERLANMGTLAAGLAHEIRNPLNAAQLQLMLIEKRAQRWSTQNNHGVTNKVLEAARLVREELHRLASLVEDFLAFARPNELRLAGGDVVDLVQSIAALLTPDVDAAGASLEVACDTNLAARFDKERITQVLINLVRNALDAAGAGGHVELAVRRNNASVEIDVIDNGPGIPDSIDVFEPFATTKDGGTGLGLAIVSRIVADHGGDIEVSRQDGKTVFAVTLPLDGPS